MKLNMNYEPINEEPNVHRWDTPASNQGQIVEVSYGRPRPHRDEAGEGDRYRRTIDHSTGETFYGKRRGPQWV